MRKARGTRVAEPERAEHFHLSHLSRKGMAASTCGLVRRVTKAGNNYVCIHRVRLVDHF